MNDKIYLSRRFSKNGLLIGREKRVDTLTTNNRCKEKMNERVNEKKEKKKGKEKKNDGWKEIKEIA